MNIKVLYASEENGYEVFTDGEFDTLEEAQDFFKGWYGTDDERSLDDYDEYGYRIIAAIVTNESEEKDFNALANELREEMEDEM